MNFYSTREAAKRIGISLITLKRYTAAKKIPLPPVRVAGASVRLWTDTDVENVRKVLPKIANGRKTRYQKLREKQKAPAGVPVPQKKRTPKKKK